VALFKKKNLVLIPFLQKDEISRGIFSRKGKKSGSRARKFWRNFKKNFDFHEHFGDIQI